MEGLKGGPSVHPINPVSGFTTYVRNALRRASKTQMNTQTDTYAHVNVTTNNTCDTLVRKTHNIHTINALRTLSSMSHKIHRNYSTRATSTTN